MTFPQWTQEEDDVLRSMWPDYSASQIAQKLSKVSRSAVIGRVHRLGLKLTSEQIAPGQLRPPSASRSRAAGASLASPPEPPRSCRHGVDFMDLRDDMCHWLLEPGHRYCGGMTVLGSSWCREHYRRAHA